MSYVIINIAYTTQCLMLLLLLGIMAKSERETWTQEMDNALIDAFLNQQNLGNKVGGTFTTKAYEAITQGFKRNLKDFLQRKR